MSSTEVDEYPFGQHHCAVRSGVRAKARARARIQAPALLTVRRPCSNLPILKVKAREAESQAKALGGMSILQAGMGSP